MNAATVTTQRKRTKRDENVIPISGTGPVGGRTATERSEDAPTVQERMRSFGFEVDVERWSEQARHDAVALLDAWELDRIEVAKGIPIAFSGRREVPDWLEGCEQATHEQVRAASELGRKAAKDPDGSSEHNPYPPQTALGMAWNDALNSAAIVNGEERASGRLFNKQETLTQLHAKLADAYAERRSKRAEVSELEKAKNAAAKEWRKADANCESVAQEIEDLLSGNYQIPLIDDEE